MNIIKEDIINKLERETKFLNEKIAEIENEKLNIMSNYNLL